MLIISVLSIPGMEESEKEWMSGADVEGAVLDADRLSIVERTRASHFPLAPLALLPLSYVEGHFT